MCMAWAAHALTRAVHALTRAAHAHSHALAHAHVHLNHAHAHVHAHGHAHAHTHASLYRSSQWSSHRSLTTPSPPRYCSHFTRWRSRVHDYIFLRNIAHRFRPPPLPCWQVRVASRRASRRAVQTRQSLSHSRRTRLTLFGQSVRTVQHAARVSSRRDLPRPPAI